MNGKTSNSPQDHSQDEALDQQLRELAENTHPRAAFASRLREQVHLRETLKQRAARPRRATWLSARTLAQGGLAALLVGLVALALTLTPQLGERGGQLTGETGTALPGQPGLPRPDGLPNGAIARLGKGLILSMDVSADGRLAIGSSLGVCVYGEGMMEQWCAGAGGTQGASEVHFAPGGQWLAITGSIEMDRTAIRVFDAAGGALLAEREIRTSLLSRIGQGTIAWSPDGQRLAYSEDNGSVSLWDWQAGALAWGPAQVFTFPEGENSPVVLAWAENNGESLLAAGGMYGLALLDGSSGAETLRLDATWQSAPMGRISAMAYTPDGSWLAYAHPGGVVMLAFDGRQMADRQMLTTDWQPGFLAFGTAENGYLLAYDSKEGIQVQAMEGGQPIRGIPARTITARTLAARYGPAAWTPQGSLYYARTDGLPGLYENGQEVVIGLEYTTLPGRLAWKGDTTLVSLWGQTINRWDAAGGSLGSVSQVMEVNAASLALSSDGAQAAYWLEGQSEIAVWDTANNQPLARWQSFYRATHGAFSIGAARLVTAGPSGQLTAWNSASGSMTREINAAPVESQIDELAVSPNGVLAALAWAEPGALHLDVWDLERGEKLASITPGASITALAFSPDGARLAGATGSDAHLWDAQSGEMLLAFGPEPTWMAGEPSQPGYIRSLAFSPDGSSLATGGSQVTVWSLADGMATLAFSGHEGGANGAVLSLAFRADGKALASGAMDGTILVWDLGAGELPRPVAPTATPLGAPTPAAVELPAAVDLPTAVEPTPANAPSPTPLPESDFHPDLYDTRVTNLRSPDGAWQAEVMWAGMKEDSPRREDYQRITVRGPAGEEWRFEQWTEAETMRTGFSELKWPPLAPVELYWFENVSQIDVCHRSWSTNLRRMDLATGEVTVVDGFGPDWKGRLAFSPDTSQMAYLDGAALVVRELTTGREQRVEITPVDPNSWGVSMMIYQPENAGVMLVQHRPNNIFCDGGPVQYAVALVDPRSGRTYQQPIPDGWDFNGYELAKPGAAAGSAILTDPQGQRYRMDMVSGEIVAEPQSESGVASAALWDFLNALAQGAERKGAQEIPAMYMDAAALYAGSLEELDALAPTGEPRDAAGLLRWACEQGDYVCLPPQRVDLERERDGFHFRVSYRQPDGSEYRSGQIPYFAFHVKRSGDDGAYRVMSLPPRKSADAGGED